VTERVILWFLPIFERRELDLATTLDIGLLSVGTLRRVVW
jgi:hypothetical protein